MEKGKILVIEDHKPIRDELCGFLSRYGYEAKSLTNYETIIEDCIKEQADLILLDINLPVLDGYYICREIRKQSEIPIIVVTSRDSEMDELMSMNLVADDFITKPYNTQILMARIASILRRSRKTEAAILLQSPSPSVQHRSLCISKSLRCTTARCHSRAFFPSSRTCNERCSDVPSLLGCLAVPSAPHSPFAHRNGMVERLLNLS